MKKIITVAFIAVLCLTLAMPAQAADSKEILINNGFEQGEEGWGVYDLTTATITVDDSQTHSGDQAMYISDKTATHGGVVQEVTQPLKFFGQGKYKVSAWIYSEEGEDAGKCSITFRLQSSDEASTANKGSDWKMTALTQLKAGAWTQITGELDLKWAADLAFGEIYFWFPGEEDGSLTNYYLDDISMVKVGYSGPNYVAPTKAPEPTATPAPTATPIPSPTKAQATVKPTTAAGQTEAPTDIPQVIEEGKSNTPMRLLIGFLMTGGGILIGGGGMYFLLKKKQVKADEK